LVISIYFLLKSIYIYCSGEGLSWPGWRKSYVTAFTVDPRNSSRLYVGTVDKGVYMSLNSGESWTEFNNGLDSMEITILTIDPKTPGCLYACMQGPGQEVFSRPAEIKCNHLYPTPGIECRHKKNSFTILPGNSILMAKILQFFY
jgi:hypothetical protein